MTDFTIEGSLFTQLECGKCGIAFLAPTHWVHERRDDGEYGREFYCPNGHCRVWRESTLDRTRRERDRLAQQIAQKNDELSLKEREIAAQKGIVTKLKKRASAGTCPCCKRTFQNMAIHMRKAHPEYAKPDLKVVAS